MPRHTLTGDDLAKAEMACGLAIAWWNIARRKNGVSAFSRKEIAAYQVLAGKLSALSDHAYPYEPRCMPSGCGDDPIMRLDADIVKTTRAAARRANRRGPAGAQQP